MTYNALEREARRQDVLRRLKISQGEELGNGVDRKVHAVFICDLRYTIDAPARVLDWKISLFRLLQLFQLRRQFLAQRRRLGNRTIPVGTPGGAITK